MKNQENISIFVQSLQSTQAELLKVQVQRVEVEDSDGSKQALALIIVLMVLLCICGIVGFIFIMRRRVQRAGGPLTETEKRYLEIADLRKSIRRADRKGQNPEEKDKLMAKLAHVKRRQLAEFIILLEPVVYTAD